MARISPNFFFRKDYVVHGVKRRSSSFNTGRVDHLMHDPHEEGVSFQLHYGDVTDATNIIRIVQETQPEEMYNLAALSHVQVSFETRNTPPTPTGLAPCACLRRSAFLAGKTRHDSIRPRPRSCSVRCRKSRKGRRRHFIPRSPYAAAKLYAYWITVNYREAYGMHASNGILFNHESPIRGETFVTRKITRAVASIECGLTAEAILGNLDSMRDWGHARDFVEGMWLILQQDKPDDYVLATGEAHSVREFVEKSFAYVGRNDHLARERREEKGFEKATGRVLVEIDPRYFRPTEVDALVGDASKARANLGWRHETSFDRLVIEMMETDMVVIRNERVRRSRDG